MNQKELYTRIFLKQADIAVNELSIKTYMPRWWKNSRTKDTGGLRLTDEGFDFLRDELDIKMYEVPYKADTEFTTQVIIWLDQFIDCPYYLSHRSMYVTNEKKALELSLFSGDIRKYGMIKALKKNKRDEENG